VDFTLDPRTYTVRLGHWVSQSLTQPHTRTHTSMGGSCVRFVVLLVVAVAWCMCGAAEASCKVDMGGTVYNLCPLVRCVQGGICTMHVCVCVRGRYIRVCVEGMYMCACV